MSIKIELNPIVDEKLSFMKTKQSDFLCASPNIAKTACNEAVFKNGAISKNRTCDPVITNDVLYH